MFGLSRFELLALAAAVLLLPALSFGAEPDAAGGASAPAASLFARLDRNKDGYLTPAELASDEAKRGNWIAVDRDRDGRISRSEFGLVNPLPGTQQPSAASGATRPPKPE